MTATERHFTHLDLDNQIKENIFFRFCCKSHLKCRKKSKSPDEQKTGGNSTKLFKKWRFHWKSNNIGNSQQDHRQNNSSNSKNSNNSVDKVIPSDRIPKSLPLRRRFEHVNYGYIQNIQKTTFTNSKCNSSMDIQFTSGNISPPPLPLRKSLPSVNNLDMNLYEKRKTEGASDQRQMREPNHILTNLPQLQKTSWYWGQLGKYDAELLLKNKENGVFLVRDSGHESYILSVSFRAGNETYHSRVKEYGGRYSFGMTGDPQAVKTDSVVTFINGLVEESKKGNVKYLVSESDFGDQPSIVTNSVSNSRVTVSLLYPFSRFKVVPSLMHLCRFEIVTRIRYDQFNQLNIPNYLKDYLKQPQYFVEDINQFL